MKSVYSGDSNQLTNSCNRIYLAEIHTLHAFASECGADGGTRAGLSRSHDELDNQLLCSGFLGHCEWIVGGGRTGPKGKKDKGEY